MYFVIIKVKVCHGNQNGFSTLKQCENLKGEHMIHFNNLKKIYKRHSYNFSRFMFVTSHWYLDSQISITNKLINKNFKSQNKTISPKKRKKMVMTFRLWSTKFIHNGDLFHNPA